MGFTTIHIHGHHQLCCLFSSFKTFIIGRSPTPRSTSRLPTTTSTLSKYFLNRKCKLPSSNTRYIEPSHILHVTDEEIIMRHVFEAFEKHESKGCLLQLEQTLLSPQKQIIWPKTTKEDFSLKIQRN